MVFMALVALLDADATWSLHWSLESKVTPKTLITLLEITILPHSFKFDTFFAGSLRFENMHHIGFAYY